MLMVEQTLTCDICGTEINSSKQFIGPGGAIAHINRPVDAGVTTWKDVCVECQKPLMDAFWAMKRAKLLEGEVSDGTEDVKG